MFRTRLVLAALAVALVAAPAPAGAQSPPLPADITDAEFLTAAAQGNQFEIVTGRLARQRAHARIVRRLGRMFVADHTRALAQGTAVATKLGVAPPAALTAQQQAAVDRLRKLRGRRFDRAWLKAQILAHAQSVELHLRGALNGDTPDVRTLAILALPVVSAHLGELTVVARGR